MKKSFRSKLFCFFKKYFSKEINSLEIESFNNGIKSEKENYFNIRKIEFEIKKDKPLIILPNEWQNPIVGKFIRTIKENDITNGTYEVFDYISNKVVITFANPLVFSEQKLAMFGKLTPDEICTLYFEGRDKVGTFRKHPNYGRDDFIYTNYDDWKEKLEKNGFYKEFGEMLKEKEQEYEIDWQRKIDTFGKP